MRRFLAISSVVAAVFAVACGDDGSAGDDARTAAEPGSATRAPEGDPAPEGTITVFAAASLTDAFADVAESFEEANPGVSIDLNFAGSSSLREQILDGAPADVFASANESNMDQLIDAGEVDSSQVFATNSLQIVVPAGNPAGISSLEDFADGDLLVGLCAEEVPCGEFGRRVLDAAGVTPSVDTDEPDVRALLTKVEAGELDAGLVYVTDVVSAGDGVEGIDIPEEFNVVASYPIGTVASTENPDAASAFVDFVVGDEGMAILEQYGFGRP